MKSSKNQIFSKKTGMFLAGTILIFSSMLHMHAQSALPIDAYGVWSRGDLEFNPAKPEYDYLLGISASGSSWKDIQPTDSASFDWSNIQESIDQATERGQYIYLGIGFGPSAPQWIYDNGVPKVFTTEEGPKKHEKWPYYPYYLDNDYKRYFKKFLIGLGEFLKDQPENKLSKIVFMQVKTGCTGDEAAYKGKANNPEYELSKSGKEWSDFRLFAFETYRQIFNSKELHIPLLFNSIDQASFPTEWEWLSTKIGSGYGIKQGALIRGHHLTGERTIVEEWSPHLVNPKDLALFSRSEMDQTWQRPLYQINIELGFYWGILNGLNQGLSVWDLSNSALKEAGENPEIQAYLRFFNKYANQIYPETSTKAFIALHEGLDAADTKKFPESKYGAASSNNQERYEAICKDPVYASRGAKMDDLYSATRGQVYQRRGQTGYNDAGWDILPGNYSRFIKQIDPDVSSIGLFRIDGPITADSPIYSRFARSFDNSSGKNAMYFKLHDDFIREKATKITFNVIYYDNEKGSKWEFQYDSGKKKLKTAFKITCEGDKKWKTHTVTISDAVLNQNGPMGSDFALVNTDDKDDIFHLIEVEKK